jgi:hypothetical protein
MFQLNVCAEYLIEHFPGFLLRLLSIGFGLFDTDDLTALGTFAEEMTGAIHFVPGAKPTQVGQFWFLHAPSFPLAEPFSYLSLPKTSTAGRTELRVVDRGRQRDRQEARTQAEDGSARCAAYLQLLMENRFPKIWVPSGENRDLRQLLWHRHRMVQMRTRIMNQLQAVALNEGLRCKKRLWRYGDFSPLEVRQSHSFQMSSCRAPALPR